jgi:hypothetical protein
MRTLRKLGAYARVLPRARRNKVDLQRWMVRRTLLLGAIGVYEGAVLFSNRADTRLKMLAGLKTSSRIGCPF